MFNDFNINFMIVCLFVRVPTVSVTLHFEMDRGLSRLFLLALDCADQAAQPRQTEQWFGRQRGSHIPPHHRAFAVVCLVSCVLCGCV